MTSIQDDFSMMAGDVLTIEELESAVDKFILERLYQIPMQIKDEPASAQNLGNTIDSDLARRGLERNCKKMLLFPDFYNPFEDEVDNIINIHAKTIKKFEKPSFDITKLFGRYLLAEFNMSHLAGNIYR